MSGRQTIRNQNLLQLNFSLQLWAIPRDLVWFDGLVSSLITGIWIWMVGCFTTIILGGVRWSWRSRKTFYGEWKELSWQNLWAEFSVQHSTKIISTGSFIFNSVELISNKILFDKKWMRPDKYWLVQMIFLLYKYKLWNMLCSSNNLYKS